MNRKVKIVLAAIICFLVFGVLSVYEGGYSVQEAILRSAVFTFFYILIFMIWKKKPKSVKEKEI